MAKICPRCGTPGGAKDKFCNNCGFDLNTPPVDHDSDIYVPDRGLWQKFFTTKGRLNPTRYVIRVMCLITTSILLIFLGALIDYLFKTHIGAIFMIPMILSFFLIIPLDIRRAHDMGRSGWYGVFAAVPILGGGLELLFRKVHWTDKWGNHHERDRLNESGALLYFFYVLIATTLSALYFIFSSGTKGSNQYGADPTGKCADVPVEDNPILGAISKLEEGSHSALKLTGIMVLIFGALSLLLRLAFVIEDYRATNSARPASIPKVENPAPQAEEKHPEVSDSVKQMIEETPPPVANKPPQPQVVAQPLTNDNQRAAVQALTSFHEGITNKNFQSAYNYFSRGLQSEISYEGWTPGFSTTVSSSVSDVRVVNESPNAIELNYILTAVDNINGRESTAQFNGTVTVINEDGQWKLDFIKNKVR